MAKLRLKKWAPVAELISAIAVVITLAFLVVGMKENTNALQAQTFQELMRDINTWRSSIRSSGSALLPKKTAEAIAGGSSDEIALIRLAFLELWGIYESAFFAKERGVLGENEWNRFEVMICFQRNGTVENAFWDAGWEGLPSLSRSLTPAFVEYIDTQCE